MPVYYIIKKNSATCKKCGDELESKHAHDFVTCKCGAVSIDGGKEYLKRVGNEEDIIETSSYHLAAYY
jgi:predicted RNA-binding Zn-ribbon protein involved in translation (DUF1610 family)